MNIGAKLAWRFIRNSVDKENEMLYLNLKRVMRLRGVENHYKMLLDLGFAPATVRNLLSNRVWRIDFENLEKICIALNCTPNDVLEWLPPENQANPEAHALIKMTRNKDADLPKLLKDLPLEQFDQIIEILQQNKAK